MLNNRMANVEVRSWDSDSSLLRSIVRLLDIHRFAVSSGQPYSCPASRYKVEHRHDPLETYLQDLRDIRSTGAAVPETSYYGCLERLLNEVGKTLKPKVRCVKESAAGLPTKS
jgi:NurA-like 5'-3' nuclease